MNENMVNFKLGTYFLRYANGTIAEVCYCKECFLLWIKVWHLSQTGVFWITYIYLHQNGISLIDELLFQCGLRVLSELLPVMQEVWSMMCTYMCYCYILESFLFTFGFWNNSNTYVWSSLENQEIMYMSASF